MSKDYILSYVHNNFNIHKHNTCQLHTTTYIITLYIFLLLAYTYIFISTLQVINDETSTCYKYINAYTSKITSHVILSSHTLFLNSIGCSVFDLGNLRTHQINIRLKPYTIIKRIKNNTVSLRIHSIKVYIFKSNLVTCQYGCQYGPIWIIRRSCCEALQGYSNSINTILGVGEQSKGEWPILPGLLMRCDGNYWSSAPSSFPRQRHT